MRRESRGGTSPPRTEDQSRERKRADSESEHCRVSPGRAIRPSRRKGSIVEHVFPIVPASGKAGWTLAAIALSLLALVGLLVYTGYSARHVRFEVSPGGLRIVGDVYGRTIPLNSLVLAEAGSVDLRRSSEYAPRWRTNGTGLPGYQAGWFRLANGEKALLFVTDPRRVVRVPTTEGFTVLLSVENPEDFLASLRATVGP